MMHFPEWIVTRFRQILHYHHQDEYTGFIPTFRSIGKDENDEEIEILRAENEEYRVLLNLLKKGESSFTGLQNADYDKINDVVFPHGFS